MSPQEKLLRQQIVEIGRLVYQKGWVAANDGNISARLPDGRMLATPTGVSKGMMHEEDLIICDMGGTKIEGRRDRTTEIAMHVTIYELRADINAVVHAHPPHATGFAVAGLSLSKAILSEVVLTLGERDAGDPALVRSDLGAERSRLHAACECCGCRSSSCNGHRCSGDTKFFFKSFDQVGKFQYGHFFNGF